MTEQERLIQREKRAAKAAAARKRQKTAKRLTLAAGAFSFVATLLVIHFTGILEPPKASTPPAAMLAARPKKAVKVNTVDPDRPNYRYSIVPGGVRSSEEVMQAILRDPVIAEHYVNVVPANLRSERLSEPVTAHVSYRIGNKVYWTKKKLTLNAGEKVLTDGTTMLRERCGNIISMDPLAPALEAEPMAPEFDLHVDPWVPTPGVDLADAPLPPGIPYVHSFTPPGPPPNVPPLDDPPAGTPTSFGAPTVVPEPSTWLLVGTGLAAGAARLLRKRK